MSSQNGNTNQLTVAVGTTPSPNGNTDPSDKKRLQGADLFRAIHNAFLVGWNLFELKSRIVVASYDIDKIDKQRPPIVPSFELVDTLLKDVKNPRRRPNLQKLPVEPSDIFWATSVWRAMFQRIVALQKPNSDTTGTVYNIPTMADKAVETFPYLYLYPGDDPNYTSVGVRRNPDAKFLENFRLYDATLRALNCLTLLFIQPGELLDFNVIKSYQAEMIEGILKADPLFNPLDDKKTALKRYTGITIRLLEGWDGYLREYFYVGQDDEDNEIELIAYEAGRSMTSLSWGISALTVPIENDLDEIDHSYRQVRDALKENNKQGLIDRLDEVLAQLDERQQLLSQWSAAILEYDKDIASIKAQLSAAFVQCRNSELMQKLEGAFSYYEKRQLTKQINKALLTHPDHIQLLAQLEDAFIIYDEQQQRKHELIRLQQEAPLPELRKDSALKKKLSKLMKKLEKAVPPSPGHDQLMHNLDDTFKYYDTREQLIKDVDEALSTNLNHAQLPAQLWDAFTKYDKRQKLIVQRDALLQQERETQAGTGSLQEGLKNDIEKALKMAAQCVKTRFIEQIQNQQPPLDQDITNIENVFESNKRQQFLDERKEVLDQIAYYANYIARIESIFYNENRRQELKRKLKELVEQQTDDNKKQSLKDQIENVFNNNDSNKLKQLKDGLKEIFVKQTRYAQSMEDVSTVFTDNNSRKILIAKMRLVLEPETEQAQLLKDIEAVLTEADTLQHLIDELKADLPQKTEIIAQLTDTFTDYNKQQQIVKQLEAFLKRHSDQTQPASGGPDPAQQADKEVSSSSNPPSLQQANGDATKQQNPALSKKQDLVSDLTEIFELPKKQQQLKNQLQEAIIQSTEYPQLMMQLDAVFSTYCDDQNYLNRLPKDATFLGKLTQKFGQDLVPSVKQVINVLSKGDDQKTLLAWPREKLKEIASYAQLMKELNEAFDRYDYYTEHLIKQLDRVFKRHEERAQCMRQLYKAWKAVFNERDIIHIQHKVASLSRSLDTSYKALDPQPTGTTPTTSLALDAIVHSLDYWQSAIDWIGSPNAQKTIYGSHSVVHGDDPIMPYELSRQLRDALIEQADIWESLITCQRTLSDITKESVTQKILSNFMEDCEKAVWQDAEIATKQAEKKISPIVWGVAIFGLLLVGIVILILVLPQDNALASNPLVGGGLSGILSVLSFLGLGSVVKNWNLFPSPSSTSTTSSSGGSAPAQGNAATNNANTSQNPPSPNTSPSIWTHLTDLVKASGSTIVDIYQQCQKVVSDELQGLDQRVSVAAPLIEFFVLNSDKDDDKAQQTKDNTNPQVHKYDFSINDSYDFLTNVIWTHGDREEELNRLVRAASGPIGTFIGGKLKATGNGTDKTALQDSGSSSQSGSSS